MIFSLNIRILMPIYLI